MERTLTKLPPTASSTVLRYGAHFLLGAHVQSQKALPASHVDALLYISLFTHGNIPSLFLKCDATSQDVTGYDMFIQQVAVCFQIRMCFHPSV